ncbi:homeobox protein CDX-1 [Python bivittatus]|uniref:Homeobox protein CDX-1 n=1 Tax=Python bivittatus TaxID=176946 RepID=A0A9F5MYV3_PYTBI|nr:homeobox protein CDX-1 [Python bivittatus]
MMYVSYLLDKDTNMYPNPVRHSGLNLSPPNYVPVPPQYSDFASYHHMPGINSDPHQGQPAGTWGSPYPPTKEDWHSYGAGAPSSVASPGQLGYSPPDFNPIPPPGSGLLPPPMSAPVPQLSPNAQRRTPYEWMRRHVPTSSNSGKDLSLFLSFVSGFGEGSLLRREMSSLCGLATFSLASLQG